MIDAKSIDMISVGLYMLFCLCELDKLYLKRKFRRDHPQRVYHSGKPLRPDHYQGFFSVRICHRQQNSRKAADMIAHENA